MKNKERIAHIRQGILDILKSCESDLTRMAIFHRLFPEDDEEGPHFVWETFKRQLTFLCATKAVESWKNPNKGKPIIFFRIGAIDTPTG